MQSDLLQRMLLAVLAVQNKGPLLMHLEALMREYQNTDMRPGKHVCNARIQVRPRTVLSPASHQPLSVVKADPCHLLAYPWVGP